MKGLEKIVFKTYQFLRTWERIFNISITRPMIQFIKENNYGKNLIGIEIGVLQGKNAYSILSTLPIKKLFLVDPYSDYEGYHKFHTTIDKAFVIAKKRLYRFDDKIEFIIKKSENAVNDVPNDLDFVYIDGNHDYEFVKRDIELYYPKIKNGGIMGGHDFCGSFVDICRATVEFANRNNLELHGKNTDWWIIKRDHSKKLKRNKENE